MVFGAVLLFSGSVNAMSEKELQEKFTKEYTINGATFKLDNKYVAQLERYLNDNEISEKDADYIASKIDEAVKIVEAGNAKSIKELTKDEKNKLKALISDISANTAVKVTVEKGGVITIQNSDGTITKITDPIKYTNDNTLAIVSIGAIAMLVGGFALVKKVSKTNA